jgi:acyl-CoA synthetase (AMP-forming)/AMP-acid ligase II
MLLTQQLITNSAKNLTKSAFRYLGKETSYKDFLSSVSRLSYLYQNELGHGIRLAYLCRNSPAVLATFLAMTNIRSTNILMDPDLAPSEIAKWLRESKATHLAVTSDLLPRARDLLQSEHLNLPIVEIEKKHGGEYDSSFTPTPDQVPKESDVILLIRSSGVTSKPKLVNITHKQILHATSSIRAHYHVLGTDRFLTTLSWSHPLSLIHAALFPLIAGATCVIDHGLQAVEFLEFITESRVTRILGTPPFFLKLLILCKNEKRTLPGIKSITVGLGSLSAELCKAFGLLKISVAHCYGQVEHLWTIAMQDTQTPGDPPLGITRGFMGKGLPGIKYKVMDSNGDEVEGRDSRIGQLALSGPTSMLGYFEKEKETKMALRGTWLYTGDLVQLDGENETLTLTLIGRNEDVISINDEFIPFSKIDPSIRSNPALQDGAAFSVKDHQGHPVIVCAAVKRAGVAVNEKQILDFCIANLPPHLAPRAVVFTDIIPRDQGNNVNCSRLRGQFSGVLG